jgi:hypothetical protein
MNRSFIIENDRERKRLQLLVERLTDEEMGLRMGEGWTIAAALAHLAFWDQRALTLMQKWKKTGVSPSPIDDDVTNDALFPLCAAIHPRVAADLAVAAAQAVDLELENASANLIADIGNLGDRFRLYRSDHRKIHLDQIEDFIKGGPSGLRIRS